MGLAEYRRKRRFNQTPEPEGGKGSARQLRFVVQKHEATRLHYDFRLELGGVLKSWAVPKGPSLNPADKRLAMMVEDHPLDYRLFEGTIPEGNYGAGTVMVWDEGTYEDYERAGDLKSAERNLRAGLHRGDLKFVLYGTKLKGTWVLAKMQGRGENNWLLIKHRDEAADTTDVTKQDRSVLSAKSMTEIAGSDQQWLSPPKLDLGKTPAAKPPATLAPMLATLVAEPFDDPKWLYEIKWDGYRIIAQIQAGKVKLQSRGDKDYTDVFAPVAAELANLQVDAVLDGEMVVVDSKGRSDFGALQNYQRTGEGNLVYYVFDLPWAAGHDLTNLPLTKRKELLSTIVAPLSRVRLSDHVMGEGNAFFAAAQGQNLEGIMAKRADSTYQVGKRGRDWLKIKTHQRQEVVIGGWTEPRGSRKKLGALVLGVYEGAELHYIGHTGGGLDERWLDELHRRLRPLERKTSPFAATFPTNAPVHWVKPVLVCEVSFAEWTGDGHLRQPIFVGLREDKPARQVRRERPTTTPTVILSEIEGSRRPSHRHAKVEITHRDKVFWPREHITKGDLADYYERVVPTILPYLLGRPESLNRHPNGIKGESFYQKDVEKTPDWVKTVPLHSESTAKDVNWVICDDRDTLLYLINLGCIELNPWHSRVESLERPDYCLIDLDAKSNPFKDVITAAQELRQLLEELRVASFPKTSGKTGLHVCIPLAAKYDYDQSKQFAELMVRHLHDRLPKLTSVERNPGKRERKIYLDYLQNRSGQTMAAPYCVRPVPSATVSTPLAWEEVKPGLDPTKFTIKTTPKRLAQVGDLWSPVLGQGINMPKVLKQLDATP